MERILDSITLNSIGLTVIGVFLIFNQLFKKHKTTEDLAVFFYQDGSTSKSDWIRSNSKMILGAVFIVAAIVLTYLHYQKSLEKNTRAVLFETLSVVNSELPYITKVKAVEQMENTLSLSILAKLNEDDINNWYSNRKVKAPSLTNINHSERDEPICVQLYRVYRETHNRSKTINLEDIYDTFFTDYYGKDRFDMIKQRHAAEMAKWKLMNPALQQNK